MRPVHKKQLLPIGLFAGVLLITLFFGLKPKGYRFVNQVKVNPADSTLEFTNIGMVYSEKTLGEIGITDSLTIVLALQPRHTGPRLQRIASIINPKGVELVAVNQWKKGVEVVLNTPQGKQIVKTGKSGVLSADSVCSFAVTLTDQSLHIITEPTAGNEKPKSVHVPPQYFSNGRISFGLSATGSNRWRGKIAGIALFKHGLKYETINGGVNRLFRHEPVTGMQEMNPAALYLFTSPARQRIADLSGNHFDLTIPFSPKMFSYTILELIPDIERMDKWLIVDMLVNLYGFLPYGACSFLFFHLWYSSKKALVCALFSGIVLSFGIEVWQIFIPTRSSQLLDVLLNGAGAAIGAVVIYFKTEKMLPYS